MPQSAEFMKGEAYLKRVIAKLESRVSELEDEVNLYRHDCLTGFQLRKDFTDMLKVLWYEYKTQGNPFICAVVDINGLHNINRDYSPTHGDFIIEDVAKQLKEHLSTYSIFRTGGDEFFILTKDDDFEKMCSKLEKLEYVEFGVIHINKHLTDVNTPDELINAVDAKMTAKKIKQDRRSEAH